MTERTSGHFADIAETVIDLCADDRAQRSDAWFNDWYESCP